MASAPATIRIRRHSVLYRSVQTLVFPHFRTAESDYEPVNIMSMVGFNGKEARGFAHKVHPWKARNTSSEDGKRAKLGCDEVYDER